MFNKQDQKSKYKVGDYIFLSSTMRFHQIVGITISGSLIRMYVKHNDTEIQLNSVVGSNQFNHYKVGLGIVSFVLTVDDFVQSIGIISVLLIMLYFADKVFL